MARAEAQQVIARGLAVATAASALAVAAWGGGDDALPVPAGGARCVRGHQPAPVPVPAVARSRGRPVTQATSAAPTPAAPATAASTAGRRLAGEVTGAPGHLAVLAADGRVVRLVRVERDGVCRLADVDPGAAWLLWTPDGPDAPTACPVAPGDQAIHALRAAPGTRVAGRVDDEHGRPVADAELTIRVPVDVPLDSVDPRLRPRRGARPGLVDARGSVVRAGALVRRVTTDAHGAFGCDGVPWADVTIEVTTPAGLVTHVAAPGEAVQLTVAAR